MAASALPTNLSEELLQRAWVQAVCALGGWEVSQSIGGTDFGVDLQISPVRRYRGRWESLGVALPLQLKASIDINVGAQAVRYELRRDAYEKLKRQSRYGPALLIVFALPTDRGGWLDVDDDRTVVRRCGWWTRGADIAWTPGNAATCTIEIPRAQRFDPTALRGPLLKLARMQGMAS